MRQPLAPGARCAVLGGRATRAVALAALLFPASHAARAQAVRVTPHKTPEVRKLVLHGVKHVDVHDLEQSIETRASGCKSFLLWPFCWVSHSPTFVDRYYLDQTEFERDVVRIRVYYWEHGYRETQVDTSVVPTGNRQVTITFDVHEGPPTRIRKLAIVYDSALISNRTRRGLTLLRANDPLDLIMLDSMRVLFQTALWNQGYGDASADTAVRVDSVHHLADVTLTLTPNHRTTIGTITVTGTNHVSRQTVLNTLTFHSGDLYKQSDVLESQRDLYESNLFRLAQIEVPPQYDTVKDVDIDVTEAPLHDVRVGPGFDNVDFLQFQSHYTDYSFAGGTRRLNVDGTVGNLFASQLQGRGPFSSVTAAVPDSALGPYLTPTYTASVGLNQSTFLGTPLNSAGIGTFAHRTINPGVYVDQGYGGDVSFTRRVAIRMPISLDYRYELNQVNASDVYFCVNYGVCDTLAISSLRQHRSLAPLSLTGFVDRSDQPFEPTSGYVARADLEYASQLTASDYRYGRFELDAATYLHAHRSKNVLSAHLHFGIVHAIPGGPDDDVLHPRKRFYAGGANSVRGFGENQLGPRVLTIDRTQLDTTSGINGGICKPTLAAIQYCDPNSAKLKDADFLPQPLGGTSLLEGSVEYRVPLPLGPVFRNFVGAVFLDGAVVGSGSIQTLTNVSDIVKGTGAVTPGFGIRYESSVGPIRVDVGFNPDRTENLAVVTAILVNGQQKIVPLSKPRAYSGGHTLLDRIALHFSIGEAY
jgi:outer membrane protein insertion porin family/translocation and assembly module TamA